MTAVLRPCNNNAVITVITTRVVFIQIAKCADRRARTMGHAGSETCFVWNALTVVFILVFWSCSSQWPQGTRSAGTIGRLQWNYNQNTKFFIHENASEKIVCEMEAILSRGRWLNIFIEGCDISMFILVIIRIGCSHSICDFHSLKNLCCHKMAVALHMIFSNAFLGKNEVDTFMLNSLKFVQVRVCQHWFK